MTTLELAAKEKRYLRTIKVLSELTRQAQLREEGQSMTQVAERLGICLRTAKSRERLLEVIERKGIDQR